MKKNSISLKDLKIIIKKIKNKTLTKKLINLYKIYKSYNEMLCANYKDYSDDILKACNAIKKQNFFKDIVFCFVFFQKFHNSQLNFISNLMKQTDLFFFISYEKKEPLFNTSKKTLETIINLCKKNNIEYRFNKNFKENFEKPKELQILKKNIFRFNKENKIKLKNIKNLKIILTLNRQMEIETALSKIADLKQQGIKYDEIAILSRNLNNYKIILKKYLEIFKIPHHFDENLTAKEMPLILMCENILKIAINFDINRYITILKFNLTDFDEIDIANFENYITTWNIDGFSIKKPFKNNPKDIFNKALTKKDLQILQKINKIRTDLNSAISYIKNSKNSIKDISLNLIKALNLLNVKNSLAKFKEPTKQWNILIEILETIFKTSQKDHIYIKDFVFLFCLTAKNIKINDIPKTLNSVYVGKIEKFSIIPFKAVIIVGSNENNFPYKHVSLNGFFTNYEVNLLKKTQLNFLNTVEDINLNEKFFIYLAITSAKKKLYILNEELDQFQNENKLNETIKEIVKIFDETIIEKISTKDILKNCKTKELAFKKAILYSNENSKEADILKKYFEKELKKLFLTNNIPKKEETLKNTKISPSEIEQFSLCPFSYFCKYQLKIKKIKKLELDELMIGIITHKILEEIVSIKNFINLSCEEIKKELEIKIYNIFYNIFNFKQNNVNSIEFLQKSDNLKLDIFKLIKEIQNELKISKFVPKYFEYEISNKTKIKPIKLYLKNNEKLEIIGKIDRIDFKKYNDLNILRIIDYKYKKKKINYYEIFNGLNLQIFLYILAIENSILNLGKNLYVSSAFYMPTTGELKKYESFKKEPDENVIENFVKKNFSLDGIILDSEKNKLFLEDLKNEKYSNYVSLKILKNKTFSKKNLEQNLILENEKNLIFSFIKQKISRINNKIENLDFAKKPIKLPKNNRIYCEYCEFVEICHEEEIEKTNNVEKFNKSIFFNIIKKEEIK